jgi:hypothetical protein
VIGGKDGKSINFTNLSSQINDARSSGYKDGEIARAVKRSVAPSSDLRTYFDCRDNMTLAEMLPIIRDFFCEKTSNDLFRELGSLAQKPQEAPTDFLIRAFQLRQKVVVTSKVEGGGYDEALVQRVFCRSVTTGLENSQIRAHMKPLLNSSTTVGDEVLLREMNSASLEIEETASKSKKTGAVKKVSVNENKVTNPEEPQSELSTMMECITKLTKQMSELQASKSANSSGDGKVVKKKGYTFNGRYKCKKCIEAKSEERCEHCFQCCDSGHQARQCKSAQTKNE